MAQTSDLMARSASLNREARELETEAVAQDATGAMWHTHAAEVFDKLSDNQIEADYHFQLADTARRKAKKLRKEADKLERKSSRIARRSGSSRF